MVAPLGVASTLALGYVTENHRKGWDLAIENWVMMACSR